MNETYSAALKLNRSFLNLQNWIKLPQQKSDEKTKIAVRESISSRINDNDVFTDTSISGVFYYFEKELFDYILDELLINARKFDSNKNNIEIFLTETFLKVVNRQNYIENYGAYTPQPFGQINRDKYEQQGLGLGLFLSKTYAERNNFELTCLITEGRFEVKLSPNS